MKTVNDRQMLALIAALIPNVDLESLDPEKVQAAIRDPKAAGLEFAAFLNNGCRMQMIGTPTIELDKPWVPDGFTLALPEEQIKSRLTGTWTYNPAELVDYLDPGQTDEQCVIGAELKSLLEGKKVMRTALARFLWENQSFIPPSWKDGKARFFWGDILCDSGGHRYVLYLSWDGESWHWVCGWLDDVFHAYNPSVCASELSAA